MQYQSPTQLQSPAALVEAVGPLDERDELGVGLELSEFAGELFHRVDVVHRGERTPEHGGGVERFGGKQFLLATRAGLLDVDRRPDAAVGQLCGRARAPCCRSL